MSKIVGQIKVGKPKGKPSVGVPGNSTGGGAGNSTPPASSHVPTFYIYGF